MQAAPAAVAYHSLFPNSCYDNSEVQVDYTTNTFPIARQLHRPAQLAHHGLHGVQSAMTQTIQVVDNLVPVVSSGLDTLFLGCIDNVVFPMWPATNAAAVSLVNQPLCDVASTCPSEF